MGTYGYISIIAMVCYGFMLLMFLAAKRNKIVNSFLVVLTGLLLWTGGSAFMRAQLWPRYEFWYQVSLLGILLLPYAYYRFILAFGGGREGIAGKSYIVAMLVCFVVNIRHGLFLACPDLVKKMVCRLLYMRSSRRFWSCFFLSVYFWYTCLWNCCASAGRIQI